MKTTELNAELFNQLNYLADDEIKMNLSEAKTLQDVIKNKINQTNIR